MYGKGVRDRFHRPCWVMSPGQLARLDWLCLTHSVCCPLSTAGSIDLAWGSLCLGCPPHPFCWYILGMFKFILHYNLGSWVNAPALVLVDVSGTEDRGLCGSHTGGFLLPCPWESTGDFSPAIFSCSHRLFEVLCHSLVRMLSRKRGAWSLSLFLF